MEFIVGNYDWNYFVPDDTDINNDGLISEREIELKFKEYMEDFLYIFDQDDNGSVTKEELRTPKLDLAVMNQILFRVMQTYPLKYWLKQADQNQNGFIDQIDFRLLSCGGIAPGGGLPRCSFGRKHEELWERYGRYILVADENGDQRLSLQEIFAH